LRKRNESGEKKNNNDTIAAIATPTGSGGIGIIRISGPSALDILKRIFIPRKKKSHPVPYLLRFGRIAGRNNSEVLDEVMAAYMPMPRSFTGEEMIEIYCHAGQFSLNAILDNILKYNCRPAEPGEFSFRRFLNHGVDLTKLEGAAEIVSSKTDLAYRLSREHLLGNYGEYIVELRAKIIHLLAEIEADIDFPDEDSVGGMGRSLLNAELNGVINNLNRLAEGYRTGRIIRDGYRVVILGPPNAGKSSLFNRLVRRNRALVTSIPGTTRDYLSEWIDIDGLPVEIFDTAGLRKGRGRVERAGIKGSQQLTGKADLVIYIFDLTAGYQKPPRSVPSKDRPLIIALNKVDLLPEKSRRINKWLDILGVDREVCVISAKTGRGIKRLVSLIYQRAGVADLTDSLVVTSHRHKIKIDRCLAYLKKISKMTDMPPEIVSFELRQAADQIGEITGHIYTEEILDEIFSNFCIGK
jgi:tRNA modification GTPase